MPRYDDLQNFLVDLCVLRVDPQVADLPVFIAEEEKQTVVSVWMNSECRRPDGQSQHLLLTQRGNECRRGQRWGTPKCSRTS